MSEEASRYVEVKSAYNSAKKGVIETIAIIEKIVYVIKQNPTREEIVIRSPIMKSSKIQSRVIIDKMPSAFTILDINSWPEEKYIRKKLEILNNLYLSTKELWNKVPNSEKTTLIPPDEKLRLQEME